VAQETEDGVDSHGMAEESKSQRLERQAVWWFAACGVGAGIIIGSILALGLMRFWRPSAVEGFCEFIGVVIIAVGIAMSFLCDKKAKWAKDDGDPKAT
jgi:hypothetical protein